MLDFDDLREQLLRTGIAPRHVRRYLTELRYHYDDLIAEERAHGVTGLAANEAASARLGSNDELAAALLAKPELRSLAARYPWLIFTLPPPLSLFILVLLWTAALVIIGGANGLMRVSYNIPWPGWYQLIVSFMSGTNNLLWPPAIASLFAYFAWRQRLSLKWPLIATAILLLNFVHLGMQSEAPVIGVRWTRHFNSLQLAWMTPFSMSGWRVIAAQWPAVLLQSILTLLPMLCLLRTYMTKENRSD